MIYITQGKGFQMKFNNGWTVSVQFGPGNYCENRKYVGWSAEADRKAGEQGSPDAEIAAWDVRNAFYNFGSDTVKGYVSPAEVVAWLSVFANMPKN